MAFYGRHRTGGLASSGGQYGDLLAELADLRSHNAHLRERISHKRQALRSEILAPDAGLQGAAACRQCGSPLRAAPPVRAASVWSAVLPATYPTTVLPYYGEDDPDVSHPSVASLPKRTQSTQYPSPSHVRAIQQLHTDELPPDLKFSTCRDRGLLSQPQRPHPSPSASVGTQASPGVVWPERSAACHVALLATLERSLMVMEDERSGFAERERQLQRALEHATLSTARHRQAAEEVRGREAVIVAELAECRDELEIFSANPSANDNVNPVGPENFPTLPTDFPEGDSDGSLSSPGAIPQHFPTLPSDFPDEDSDGTLSVAGAPQELSAGSPDVVPSHPLYTTHDTTGHDGGDDLRQFGAAE